MTSRSSSSKLEQEHLGVGRQGELEAAVLSSLETYYVAQLQIGAPQDVPLFAVPKPQKPPKQTAATTDATQADDGPTTDEPK